VALRWRSCAQKSPGGREGLQRCTSEPAGAFRRSLSCGEERRAQTAWRRTAPCPVRTANAPRRRVEEPKSNGRPESLRMSMSMGSTDRTVNTAPSRTRRNPNVRRWEPQTHAAPPDGGLPRKKVQDVVTHSRGGQFGGNDRTRGRKTSSCSPSPVRTTPEMARSSAVRGWVGT